MEIIDELDLNVIALTVNSVMMIVLNIDHKQMNQIKLMIHKEELNTERNIIVIIIATTVLNI